MIDKIIDDFETVIEIEYYCTNCLDEHSCKGWDEGKPDTKPCRGLMNSFPELREKYPELAKEYFGGDDY